MIELVLGPAADQVWTSYINFNYPSTLSLSISSTACHLSPHHPLHLSHPPSPQCFSPLIHQPSANNTGTHRHKHTGNSKHFVISMHAKTRFLTLVNAYHCLKSSTRKCRLLWLFTTYGRLSAVVLFTWLRCGEVLTT